MRTESFILSSRCSRSNPSETAIYLRSRHPLGLYPVKLTDRLEYWAKEAPNRVFLGARANGGRWRTITYGQFRRVSRNVAQALLDRGLTAKTPVAIHLLNGIEHAVASVAAMYVGIPSAPVSPNKLDRIVDALKPGMIVTAATDFLRMARTAATSAVDQAHDSVTADTVAKILFTSGTTGEPVAVVNTQRMLTSNQEMILTAIPSLRVTPPILCDWLPWHHTFGGNHNFGIALYNGGTLYIDEGRPETMAESIRNLRDIAPTLYFNVPRGFEALAQVLCQDAVFASQFFSRLEVMFCAAASLPQQTREALTRLSSVPIVTGFGCTETGPLTICSSPGLTDEAGIGLPVPGVELKLTPNSGKLELSVRGPNVSPGVILDEEGFYRTGDAVRFADPAVLSRGLIFDGRLGEDFKLSSGTWVNVGSLRREAMFCCHPYLRAVVIVGQNRNYVTALLFPTPEAAKDRKLHAKVADALKDLAARSTGSSRRIERAAVVREALSAEAGEITGKGSVNYAAVLAHRTALIESLYSIPAMPELSSDFLLIP